MGVQRVRPLAGGVWGGSHRPTENQTAGTRADHFPFRLPERGEADRPARAELESMRACPLARVWAGVRPGAGVWGRRKSPMAKKRLNRCQSSRVSISGRSILVHEHDSNGGLRVVNVERAANGGQPDKAGAAVVVADIERHRQTVATGAAAENGKAGHCDYIPEPASFVLAGHAGRHGHVSVIDAAGEKNRETDSGFLRGFGNFNLYAVGDGLRSGVRKDDFAKGRVLWFVFMVF